MLDYFEEYDSVLIKTAYFSQSISTEIAKLLVEFRISPNQIVAIVTDNASNMLKMLREGVKINVSKDAVHITCFAHIVNLISTTWKNLLKKLDTYIGCVKNIFSKSRKIRYISYLKDENAFSSACANMMELVVSSGRVLLRVFQTFKTVFLE